MVSQSFATHIYTHRHGVTLQVICASKSQITSRLSLLRYSPALADNGPLWNVSAVVLAIVRRFIFLKVSSREAFCIEGVVSSENG
jgi:hypothetical protein